MLSEILAVTCGLTINPNITQEEELEITKKFNALKNIKELNNIDKYLVSFIDTSCYKMINIAYTLNELYKKDSEIGYKVARYIQGHKEMLEKALVFWHGTGKNSKSLWDSKNKIFKTQLTQILDSSIKITEPLEYSKLYTKDSDGKTREFMITPRYIFGEDLNLDMLREYVNINILKIKEDLDNYFLTNNKTVIYEMQAEPIIADILKRLFGEEYIVYQGDNIINYNYRVRLTVDDYNYIKIKDDYWTFSEFITPSEVLVL